jgi:hypothetical protein
MLLLTLHAKNAKLISHLAGMGSPQDIPKATFTGKPDSEKPEDLAPSTSGINFTKPGATIKFPFGPGVTPIVTSVSVPKGTTNVVKITVIITAPNGTKIFEATSPKDTNTVTGFPVKPLPEGSIVTVKLTTRDEDKPATGVTLSVIACYTPSNATTVVTTGTPTATPTATTVSTKGGSTSTLIMSVTTAMTKRTEGK